MSNDPNNTDDPQSPAQIGGPPDTPKAGAPTGPPLDVEIDMDEPEQPGWPPRDIQVDNDATRPPAAGPAAPAPGGPSPQSPYGAPMFHGQQAAYQRPMPGAPGGPAGGRPAAAGAGQPPYRMPPRTNFFQTITKIVGIILFVGCLGCTVYLLVGLAMYRPIDEYIDERVIREGGSEKIAVIAVNGMIDDAQVWRFQRQVSEALDDARVRAVVLSIDSGGGTVDGSEQIYQIVNNIKSSGRAVVAHYGGLAASGALYCSAGAQKIYAQENTLTGSIGVLTSVVVADKLLREKLGVEVFTITSTDATRKTLGDTMKLSGEFTPADRKEVLRLLDHYHALFVDRVFTGRQKIATIEKKVTLGGKEYKDAKWTLEWVRRLADGSIYTFEEAKACGLVDAKGDLDDAVNGAAVLAGLSAGSYKVVRYFDMFELMMSGRSLLEKDININIGPVSSDDIGVSRGRFMYLSRYRR